MTEAEVFGGSFGSPKTIRTPRVAFRRSGTRRRPDRRRAEWGRRVRTPLAKGLRRRTDPGWQWDAEGIGRCVGLSRALIGAVGGDNDVDVAGLELV